MNGATARGSRAITSELANLGRPTDLERSVSSAVKLQRFLVSLVRGSRAITSELANLGRSADLEQNIGRKTTKERASCTP